MTSLPRHKLLRLAALDLVRALLGALASVAAQSPAEPRRGELAVLCSRVEMHRDKAFRLTVNGELLDLSGDDKSSSRYRRAIATMQREICSSWPERLDASGFLAAVLGVVAKAEEQLPRTMDYLEHRLEWGRLHALLAEVYELFDPDYLDAAGIEHGSRVGERMAGL